MAAKFIRFGLFELNTSTRQLLKQGRRVRLQEQPMRVLEILLAQPGELVTRQELRQRLWPSDIHVDFELGLTGAVKRLRLALVDLADTPRFIETVPKSGYRFIAPVQPVSEPIEPEQAARTGLPPTIDASQVTELLDQTASGTPLHTRRSIPRNRRYWIPAFVVVFLLIGGYLLRPRAPLLQVTHIARLSNSGHAWFQENLLSDGARLYYTQLDQNKGFQLRQILLNGNEDALVGGLPSNFLVRGLSPDHTTFLGITRAAAENGSPAPYWVVPVVGGPLRRLGNFMSNDVTWSPDGSSLAFARHDQLLMAGADGTGEHVLATVPGWIFLPRWSPDGHRLRFSVQDRNSKLSIWEVGADGGHLHQMQFNWPGSPMEAFGEWTPDGRYYVFVSRREGVSNLWAIEDTSNWLHRARPEPMQLTAGPMSYSRPLPSLDGKRIFAVGTQLTGELLRYDATRKDFVPFLGGRSADHLDFSRDGRWVTYVAYPEGTLWRAQSDGDEQLQLTFSPLRASRPCWSPDGKQILFVGARSGELPKIYTISRDGGAPEPLVSEPHAQNIASWSPAGDFILYGRDPDGENQDIALYRFDPRTSHTEKIPGTEGLSGPLWSPDGRRLAASSNGSDRTLVLLDLKTGKRTMLTRRKADYPAWSADSQYLYFNTMMTDRPALFRVHVMDGKEEKITDVHFEPTGLYGMWSGLAPDGSPLVLRNREQTDVYSLSLAFH